MSIPFAPPPKDAPIQLHLEWIQQTAARLVDEWAYLAARRAHWATFLRRDPIDLHEADFIQNADGTIRAENLRPVSIPAGPDIHLQYEMSRWQRLWDSVLPLFQEAMLFIPDAWNKYPRIRTPHDAETTPQEATAQWDRLRGETIIRRELRPVAAISRHPPQEMEAAQDYIDLDQAAALVNRSKKTLERKLKDPQMPPPRVQGAGGTKHEWIYSELKPWLESEFGKNLPDRPPHCVR